jgi:hypothetical protein
MKRENILYFMKNSERFQVDWLAGVPKALPQAIFRSYVFVYNFIYNNCGHKPTGGLEAMPQMFYAEVTPPLLFYFFLD